MNADPRELLIRSAKGDHAAWTAVVRLYQRVVYSTILAFRLPAEEAEAVFHEVFLQLYRNLERIAGEESARDWLVALTNRLCHETFGLPPRVEEPAPFAGATPIAGTTPAGTPAEPGPAGRPEIDPPDLWSYRAEQLTVPPDLRRAKPPLRQEARVVFDRPAIVLATESARGGASSRRLVLATDTIEIELRIAPTENRISAPLIGQLWELGGTEMHLEAARIRIEDARGTCSEVMPDDSGAFEVPERPAGPFRLVVEGPGWTVQTPVIDLRA
jgi:hypothetical protein